MFIKTIGDALINSDFVRRYDMREKNLSELRRAIPVAQSKA